MGKRKELEKQVLSQKRVIKELGHRLDRLDNEINILRQYGNKDCTAMADAVLKEQSCSIKKK